MMVHEEIAKELVGVARGLVAGKNDCVAALEDAAEHMEAALESTEQAIRKSEGLRRGHLTSVQGLRMAISRLAEDTAKVVEATSRDSSWE